MENSGLRILNNLQTTGFHLLLISCWIYNFPFIYVAGVFILLSKVAVKFYMLYIVSIEYVHYYLNSLLKILLLLFYWIPISPMRKNVESKQKAKFLYKCQTRDLKLNYIICFTQHLCAYIGFLISLEICCRSTTPRSILSIPPFNRFLSADHHSFS